MDIETMAKPVVRGCGRRIPGGIYFETGLSPFGVPITEFLWDPPVPLEDPRDVAAIGTQLQERDGVFHILDWVGEIHYPNVTDFIEEVKRFGLSRRLAETHDFSKLSSQSRILLIHPRAFIRNFKAYQQWHCPKGYESHRRCCIKRGCGRVRT